MHTRSHETVVEWTTAAVESDDAAAQLEAAERAVASVQQIPVWPFDRSGLPKLLLSALIPLAHFVLTTLKGVLGF